LEPFLAGLHHAARRAVCPNDVAGLIGLGERMRMHLRQLPSPLHGRSPKLTSPMAARQKGLSYDRLQHFISVGRWDGTPLARALLAETDRMAGERDAVLVVDDTTRPKKGRHAVGVAPQYLSAQGKTGNCQAMVSLTLARRELPVLLGLHLFLPASWTDDAARMAQAGVPEEERAARTKPEIALSEVDRVGAAGVRFGPMDDPLSQEGFRRGKTQLEPSSQRALSAATW